MKLDDCLIEIGTEELPPKALRLLSETFAKQISASLQALDMAPSKVEVFATPRRLAVLLKQLPVIQANQLVERKGPPVSAAFDAQGQASRAALGFAKSCGVDIDQLERRQSKQGEWLYFVATKAGQSLADLLPEMVTAELGRLPIPKRMRWGTRNDEFVRPLKWLVMMIGSEVVSAEIFGLESGRLSYGHRFHAPGVIRIEHASDYEQILQTQGFVIASFEKRREEIRRQIEKVANDLNGEVKIDPSLLEEVTGLVEYPIAISGNFDAGYLKLPAEVLVTTMQDNQKYFALFDQNASLLPHFIAIANIDSKKPELVSRGNERVIRPRFADARFFYQQDRKRGLDEMCRGLDRVVFQKQLGNLWDKSSRITRLAKYIASHSGADQDLVRRAAELCKADLMSDMVGEFPKLQGLMGHYYARHQQEVGEVCEAIEQHYWPRFAGDSVPQGKVAIAIALADRLDTLLGIFAIGAKPGGDKDPFGLRRAALGVLRIIIENQLSFDIVDLSQAAADGYQYNKVDAQPMIGQVVDYIFDRMPAYYLEQGIGSDLVEAVVHDRPTDLYDCDQRICALHSFRRHDAAPALAAANKRINNILKKLETIPSVINPELLQAGAEQALWEQLETLNNTVSGMFAGGDYQQGLLQLAELRPAVDLFFDQVMVMADDDAVRENRLALLSQLLQLFRKVADFSRIQS